MSIVTNRRPNSINYQDRANDVNRHNIVTGGNGLGLASCTFFKIYLLIDNLYYIYIYIYIYVLYILSSIVATTKTISILRKCAILVTKRAV